jgi:PPOX class probable F420-dependent enzyme
VERDRPQHALEGVVGPRTPQDACRARAQHAEEDAAADGCAVHDVRLRSAAMPDPRAEAPAMGDYGVGGPSWAPLPWSWAAERLARTRNYWVVTVSGDGRPHALPVWGVWDVDESRFVFSCSPNARKARNLAANPRAVVTVDDTVECVSVEGRAAPVRDPARVEQWVQRYVAKYAPISPQLEAEFVRSHLLVEFEPERAFGIVEREEEFADRATRWVWG